MVDENGDQNQILGRDRQFSKSDQFIDGDLDMWVFFTLGNWSAKMGSKTSSQPYSCSFIKNVLQFKVWIEQGLK